MEAAAGRDRHRVRRLPLRICGRRRSRGSRRGTTESSAFVYGCCGFLTTAAAGPSSTIRPRYMTAIRSAKRAAVDRSWVIMRIARPLLAQAVEHVQHAGPDRDVEHRDRLVGDEEVGLEDERGCDRDPLALTAGELVREAVEEELGRRELDLDERIANARCPLGLRAAEVVDQERLLDRCADPEPRVERLVRILIDDLDPAAQRTQLSRAERHEVAAVEADRAGDGIDEPRTSPGRSSSCRSPTRRRGRASLPAASTVTRRRRRARCGAAGAWPTRRGRGGSGSGRRDPRPRAASVGFRVHAGTRELRWQAAS